MAWFVIVWLPGLVMVWLPFFSVIGQAETRYRLKLDIIWYNWENVYTIVHTVIKKLTLRPPDVQLLQFHNSIAYSICTAESLND